jgi:hypothetical protein
VVVDIVSAVIIEGGCKNNTKRELYSGRLLVLIDLTSLSLLLNGSLT